MSGFDAYWWIGLRIVLSDSCMSCLRNDRNRALRPSFRLPRGARETESSVKERGTHSLV